LVKVELKSGLQCHRATKREAPLRYAEPYIEDTMSESVKTQLSDSVRKLSKLSRQVSGVAATDLTPRERGDLIAELQSLATTFDALAAHTTGEEMLDTAWSTASTGESSALSLQPTSYHLAGVGTSLVAAPAGRTRSRGRTTSWPC
jgi:hypothetical protein